MIDVTIFMNSSMEDVLSCRCAGIHNQNLEIHVHNKGNDKIHIQNRFVFENNDEIFKCDNIFPPWSQSINPGCALAFYCSIDEQLWNSYTTITVFDGDNNNYIFPIDGK
ncbi:MAG: hypothetical protein KAH06_02390 [Desulfobacterales bacterium]|nr:hypothetical protein [Desulfobacterales bacterium]